MYKFLFFGNGDSWFVYYIYYRKKQREREREREREADKSNEARLIRGRTMRFN